MIHKLYCHQFKVMTYSLVEFLMLGLHVICFREIVLNWNTPTGYSLIINIIVVVLVLSLLLLLLFVLVY